MHLDGITGGPLAVIEPVELVKLQKRQKGRALNLFRETEVIFKKNGVTLKLITNDRDFLMASTG